MTIEGRIISEKADRNKIFILKLDNKYAVVKKYYKTIYTTEFDTLNEAKTEYNKMFEHAQCPNIFKRPRRRIE